MQQKELATLLDISPAMVSRLAKRGMPTDTLERAQRWRKRHLEPGRVKGIRYERGTTPKPAPPTSPPRAVAYVSDDEVEVMAGLVNAALASGNQDVTATRIGQLRKLLPHTAPDASPRLTLRVWLALLIYMLHEEVDIRNAPDMGALLTPGECGARVCPAHPWPASVVIYEACDFDNHSIIGWPDGVGDDDPE